MAPANIPLLSFSLHLQPISRMERLSIESCIDAGYEHRAYVYESQRWLGVLPVPAMYHDAVEIIPKQVLMQDKDEKHTNFRLLFMCAALFRHGGLWVDNDYVLTQPVPYAPFVAVKDPDQPGLCPYVLRLPPGSALAQRAVSVAESELADSKTPVLDLMGAIQANWPARHDAKILTAAQACPFGLKHAKMLINPAPELDQENVYGYKLWRAGWERDDTTPASKFHHMAPYEQLWSRYFGMRIK